MGQDGKGGRMGRVMTMIAAALGALLVMVVLNWAASVIYAPRVVPLSYAIGSAAPYPSREQDAPVDEAVPPPAPDLLAGDPTRGAGVFVRCHACHRDDGVEAIGPHLNGVVGRQKASVAGFAYSGALRAMEDEAWTPERLDAFLRNPRGYAPGTKMAFAGLRDAQDRADVIAYLRAHP